jgi:hypothetical protein
MGLVVQWSEFNAVFSLVATGLRTDLHELLSLFFLIHPHIHVANIRSVFIKQHSSDLKIL